MSELGIPDGEGSALAPFELITEMTQDFASSLDIERTVGRALTGIVEHLDAVAGCLWLLENNDRELVCHAWVGPHQIAGQRLPASEGIIGRSVRENLCQAVLDVSRDPNFARRMDDASGLRTRSVLCAPMSVKARSVGAIELVNKQGENGRFPESDLHILRALAAEIQRNLLPPARPSPSTW